MKKRKLFFSLYFCLIISLPAISQIGNSEDLYKSGLKRYPTKSGTINYEITGGATGKATLWFDNGGWLVQTKREFTYTLYGLKNEVITLEGQDGDSQYTVDLKSLKGSHLLNKTESGLMRYKDVDAVNLALYASKGGVYVGDTTLLSYKAKIWQFEKGNPMVVWESGGMMLYQKRKIGNIIYEQIATSVEELFNPIVIPGNIDWNTN